MFTGQITLNCNFGPLPECLPDSGDTITTDEYIAEQPIAYPPLGPDPIQLFIYANLTGLPFQYSSI